MSEDISILLLNNFCKEEKENLKRTDLRAEAHLTQFLKYIDEQGYKIDKKYNIEHPAEIKTKHGEYKSNELKSLTHTILHNIYDELKTMNDRQAKWNVVSKEVEK